MRDNGGLWNGLSAHFLFVDFVDGIGCFWNLAIADDRMTAYA
jgi:hypothetical protein